MRKIRDSDGEVVNLSADLRKLLMRTAKKVFQDSQLVHHLERGGMHGIAAKIAKEIGVLFKHDDINSGANKQIAAHHSRGAAAHYAATRADRFGGWIFLGHGSAGRGRFTSSRWGVARAARRDRRARAPIVRGSAGNGWLAVVFRRARGIAAAHLACGGVPAGPARLVSCSCGPLSTEIPGPDLPLPCFPIPWPCI